MKYTSNFRIDISSLFNLKDAEKYIEIAKTQAASELGINICKDIPFELNKEVSADRRYTSMMIDKGFEEYRCEFIAFSMPEWQEFIEEIKLAADINDRDLRIAQFKKLLS